MIRKWKPLQKTAVPPRKESSKPRVVKNKTSQRLSIKDEASLKKVLKVMPETSLKNLSDLQGMKRFQKLTLKENTPLIEELAKQYAKVFNAGFSLESVGLETYYTVGEKETFCFTSLKGFEKLPQKKVSEGNEDTIVKRMMVFRYSIQIDEMSARHFFVQEFKKNLSPEHRDLFNRATLSQFLP